MNTEYDVLSFDPARQTSLFEVRGYSVSIAATGVRIAQSDPQRVLIAFYYPLGIAAGVIGVYPGNGDAASLSFQVPNVDRLEFKYSDYGATVGMDWYGFQTIPGGTLCVMEVVYRVKASANRNKSLRNSVERILKSGSGTTGCGRKP